MTDKFTQITGFTILPDETVIDLYGIPTLLLHGDSLCTDDIAHQQFRQAMTTNIQWQTQFLSLPIEERIQQAKMARAQSQQNQQALLNMETMDIMDTNESTVINTFKKHDVHSMIHGHTHRQQTHQHQTDGITMTRTVLGDWGAKDSVLKVNAQGMSMINQEIRV